MADNILQLGITIDAGTVPPSLSQVNSAFQATTAAVASQWREASATVTASLSKMADGAEQAAGRTKEQIEKASGAVGLLSDLIGIKVPGELQKMLAESTLVGPALEAAFSGIAIIALGDLVLKLGEKIVTFMGSLGDLTEAEKKYHDQVVKDVGEELHFLEEQIKAQYAVQIAKAHGDDVGQQTLRVEMYAALVSAGANYVKQLKDEQDRLRQLARQSESTAEGMESSGAEGAAVVMNYERDKANAYRATADAQQKSINEAGLALQRASAAEIEASARLEDIKRDQLQNQQRQDAAQFKKGEQAFKQHLAEKLDELKQNHQVSLSEELHFWQSKLAAAAAYPDVYRQIMHRIAEIDQGIYAQRTANQNAYFRTSEEQANRWVAENMRLAKESNDAIIKDNKAKLDAAAAYYDGQMRLAKTDEQIQEQNAERDLALGKITKQQEIAAVAAAKQQELRLEIQYLRAKEQLYEGDEKQVAKIEGQISDLIELQDLTRAKADAASAKASQQAWKKAVSGMENLFSSFTQNIISGHKTIAQSWANLVDGMASKFLEGIEKQIFASIEGSIRQTAIDEQTAAAGNAIDQANSAKTGLRAAIDAAKGAWKWAANNDLLPFAPVIAAGAFAAVEAFGSAEGGQWEVPGQQWTLVHPKESIIPSYIASPMRAFFENGGNQISTTQAGYISGVQGGSPVHVHFHVNAIDGADAASFIQRNANHITNVLFKQLKKKGFPAG